MPHYTVTVGRDWKFSPPSIQSELPCHLSFKLHPFTGQLQIQVLDSSDNEVASSGPLKAGDCFSTTITEPGSYAFTSNTHSFMSGHLVATGTATNSSSNTCGKLEAEPSVDCISTATGLQQQESAAAAECAGKGPAASKAGPASTGKRSASPNKGSAATAAAQHRQPQQQQQGDGEEAEDASDRSDTPTAGMPDRTATATLSAAAAAAAMHGAVGGLGPAGRRSSCGSDAWDTLQQQPSELAVLELVTAGAQPQHTHAAAAAPAQLAQDTASRFAPAAELSRAGRWARRATAYDDELDVAFHQEPTAELRQGLANLQCAGGSGVRGRQPAAGNGSSAAVALQRGSSSSLGDEVGAAPEAEQQQQQQQQQQHTALGKVRFAMGIEGLDFTFPAAANTAAASAAATAGAAAAAEDQGGELTRASSGSSSVLQGSCKSDSHNPLASGDEAAGSAGSGKDEDAEGDSDMEGGGLGEYELLCSNSSQISSDYEGETLEDRGISSRRHVQQQQQQGLSSDPSEEDIRSEGARLLSAQAARSRCDAGASGSRSSSGRPGRLAWQASSSAQDAGSTQVEVCSDAGSDSDSGEDMRLQRVGSSRRPGLVSGSRVEQVDSSAQTSPLFAARFSQPPGSSWALGGSTHKTFSSTAAGGHNAVRSLSGKDSRSTASPSGYGKSSSSSSSSSRLAATAAAVAAQAAAGETAVAGLNKILTATTSSSSSASSTLLGPGTHRLGQRLPPISINSSSKGSAAAVASSMQDTIAALGRAQQQVGPPGAVGTREDGYEPLLDGPSSDDGVEASHPPPLQARLAKREQLLHANVLAARGSDSLHSRNSSSGGSSGVGAAPMTAAAAGAKGAAATSNKKKKGKGKAGADKAANDARAAVEARRREKDCVEFALLDSRGTSSRGDSEVRLACV